MLVGADVMETLDPSAYVIVVVVVPSLLVVEVLDAPCSACISGSVAPSADVVAPSADVPELFEPPELATA